MSARRAGSGGRPVGLPKTGGRKKGTPNRATFLLREKLAALECDPAEELVKIARDSRTTLECKVDIYSTLLAYVYPKRKPADDSDAERVTVNAQALTPDEALNLARQIILIYSPRAAAQRESATSVINSEPGLSAEERADEH